jgi:hypothetical protein
LKCADFGLAVRNADPDVGKVLLNEMWERNDGFFFGCTERRDSFNFVLSIPNLSLESGDSSWNVHVGESELARFDERSSDFSPVFRTPAVPLVSNSTENRYISRFRTMLPTAQCGLAALFGGFGLWQRCAILSRPFFEGQTLWHSTAQFHVWPWPFKFAVVSNVPAFFASGLLLWPIGAVWPELPESVQVVQSLLLVLVLWYWVGSRLDQWWSVTDKTPWIGLAVFILVCLVGTFLRIGYTGFIPYGFLVWLSAVLTISRCTSRSPIPSKQPKTAHPTKTYTFRTQFFQHFGFGKKGNP